MVCECVSVCVCVCVCVGGGGMRGMVVVFRGFLNEVINAKGDGFDGCL